MDPRDAILFEPVTVGPKTLPNRFYQVPHASGFGSIKPRTQAAFRAIKAEGGWGGVCVEYAPVSRDADEVPAVAADMWDEADARRLALTAEALHARDAGDRPGDRRLRRQRGGPGPVLDGDPGGGAVGDRR